MHQGNGHWAGITPGRPFSLVEAAGSSPVATLWQLKHSKWEISTTAVSTQIKVMSATVVSSPTSNPCGHEGHEAILLGRCPAILGPERAASRVEHILDHNYSSPTGLIIPQFPLELDYIRLHRVSSRKIITFASCLSTLGCHSSLQATLLSCLSDNSPLH